MRRRVVVTGLGVVSPAGCSKNELWTNIQNGRSHVHELIFNNFDKLPSKVGATINPEKLTSLVNDAGITDSKLRTISRSTTLAILATKEAVADAQLIDCSPRLKQNIGVFIGSGMSDFMDICDMDRSLKKSYNRVSPYFIPRILLNMAAGNVSMMYEFQGPNHCVSTACATGAHAIGDSYRIIRNGNATAMVCGGTEASINPLTVAGFCRIRALSTSYNETPHEASRPFDENRDGFVIGEGSGILVLEEMDHALQRNAKIYAEILGYGMSGDAAHLTAPHSSGRGAILAMSRAVQDAAVNAHEITYVNAHATSTPVGDNIELEAIGEVFESSSQSVFVSSTKGCHGHLLGAAGSVESICTVLTCYHAVIPPTANLKKCSPHRSNLRCNATKEKWERDKRIALKNSFGFGGTNATLCISNFVL